jgi:hypothetical protein
LNASHSHSAWSRACAAAASGNWSALITQSFSNHQLASFIADALMGSIALPNLQNTNPHEICVLLHAVACKMQLQWMLGFITDVGFMRVNQLLLLFCQAILEDYKNLPPFLAGWRRVCSTAEAIVQHTSHVLLMTTGYREAAAGTAAAASQVYPQLPRGHAHFAYRFVQTIIDIPFLIIVSDGSCSRQPTTRFLRVGGDHLNPVDF